MGQPIKPRNEAAPNGTSRIITSSEKELKRSLKRIGQRVIKMMKGVRTVKVPDNDGGIQTNVSYYYLISAYQLMQMGSEIEGIIAYEMSDSELDPFLLSSFNLGTTQAIANLANQTTLPYDAATKILSPSHMARVAIVQNRTFEYMQNLNTDMKANLNRILSNGMVNGESPFNVARQIRDEIGIPEWNDGNSKASYSRALKIARTEINNAHREAIRAQDVDANELGIKTKLLWFSSMTSTTRRSHARRHGHLYDRDEVADFYSRNANAINCFHPDTLVSGRFVAGSKAWYEGRMINIMTASGLNLSVTPNHPLMTSRGLIAAGEITKSDNLIACPSDIDDGSLSFGLGSVHDGSSVMADLNGKRVNAKISEVFSALEEVGHSAAVGVSVVDFHGDGEFIKENVDIVRSDRVLTYTANSNGFKALDKLSFVKSDSISSGIRSLNLGLKTVLTASSGLLAFACNGSLVFFSGLIKPLVSSARPASELKIFTREPIIYGFPRYSDFIGDLKDRLTIHMFGIKVVNIKPVSDSMPTDDNLNTITGENSFDDTVRNAKFISDTVHGSAGLVRFDDVVSIEVFDFCGHVYDLQEVSGLMYANSLMVSNCKCSQSSVVVNNAGEPENPEFVESVKKSGEKYFKD